MEKWMVIVNMYIKMVHFKKDIMKMEQDMVKASKHGQIKLNMMEYGILEKKIPKESNTMHRVMYTKVIGLWT